MHTYIHAYKGKRCMLGMQRIRYVVHGWDEIKVGCGKAAKYRRPTTTRPAGVLDHHSLAIRGARQVIPLCTAVNVTSTDSVYADRRNECTVSGQRQETVNIVDKATTYLHPFMKTTDVGWLWDAWRQLASVLYVTQLCKQKTALVCGMGSRAGLVWFCT